MFREPSDPHLGIPITVTLSLTGEARAEAEVHLLHTHGEHELTNVTCSIGKEGRKRVRNTKDVGGKKKNKEKSEE